MDFLLAVSDFIIDYLVVLNKNGESAFYCGRGGKENDDPLVNKSLNSEQRS